MSQYNPEAVDQAIAASNRAGRRIGGREARQIHALLKGWRGSLAEKRARESELAKLAAASPIRAADQHDVDGLELFDRVRQPSLF